MKQWIRSYALGLLTAALVFAITYLNTNDTASTTVEKEYETQEMIEQLESEGYRALTTSEWESLNENAKREAPSPTPVEETPLTTFSIDIVSGTTTDDISEKLLQANIIEDAAEFETFMKENDYSRYIQIGQSTLNSKMSLKEIAEAITSK